MLPNFPVPQSGGRKFHQQGSGTPDPPSINTDTSLAGLRGVGGGSMREKEARPGAGGRMGGREQAKVEGARAGPITPTVEAEREGEA